MENVEVFEKLQLANLRTISKLVQGSHVMILKDAILDYLAVFYRRFRLQKRQVSYKSFLSGFGYSKRLSRDLVEKLNFGTRRIVEVGLYVKIIDFRFFHLSHIQKCHQNRYLLPDKDSTDLNLFQFSHFSILAKIILFCCLGSILRLCYELKSKFFNSSIAFRLLMQFVKKI